MSINHLIDSAAVPKYDIYCNDIDVQGEINVDGAINVDNIFATNAYVSQDVDIGLSLQIKQDEAGEQTLGDLPYLESFGPTDGFGGLPPSLPIKYAIRTTETSNRIIRSYMFQFNDGSADFVSEFKINFLPIIVPTSQLWRSIDVDFRVIYVGGTPTFNAPGATIASQIEGVNPTTLTLTSNLAINSLYSGAPHQIYIKVITTEDK